MAKKFIAYQGDELTIEWYFDAQGKSASLQYYRKLSSENKKKLIHLFYVLGDIGKIFNKEKFRYEGNKIYAIKSSPNRFLCFFYDGAKIIITNAYEKKSQKMLLREKQKAVKARIEYIKRCKKDDYYE